MKDARKGSFAAATVTGLLASLFALVLVGTSQGEARAGLLDAPFREAGQRWECGTCDVCVIEGTSEIGHVTGESSEGLRKLGPEGAHENDCQENSDCQAVHPVMEECADGGEGLASLEMSFPELWNAVRLASGEELRHLADRFPTRIKLNAERAAIQIHGCKGALVAHIPLEPAQLSAVE